MGTFELACSLFLPLTSHLGLMKTGLYFLSPAQMLLRNLALCRHRENTHTPWGFSGALALALAVIYAW